MKKLIKEHINKKLPKGGFARSAATLMTGTTIAQAISFLISPILTRIYTPEDFGLFALFSATVAMVTVLITLKYENAVMLPDNDADAVNIVALSVILALIISTLVLLTVIIFGDNLMGLINNKGSRSWLLFYPIIIFFMGIYLPFYNWLNRLGRYKTMAYRSIIQSMITSGLSLSFGLIGFRSTGLILSYISGQMVVVFILSYDVYVTSKHMMHLISVKKMIAQMKRYVQFPMYDLSSSFVSLVATQSPIFMFTKYFGSTMVGSYSYTNKILGVPSNLMSNSILCVFKQRATQDYNKNGNCIGIYKKTFKNLLIFSVVPFVIFVFFSPSLFEIIFGHNWRLAGEFASILSFMFFIRFITSPLAYMFYVAEKQRYDFIGQVLFAISTANAIFLGVYYNNLKLAIITLTVGNSLIYILYLIVSYKLATGYGYKKRSFNGDNKVCVQ